MRLTKLIPQELVEQVRQAHDIVDVVSQYVQLKKSGRNYFGLCPFHSEKTPSFSVAPDKQIYYCFGCGKGGNVLSFLMEIEGLTFQEVVKDLADKAGILLPQLAERDDNHAHNQGKNQIYEAYTLTAKYYNYLLEETPYGQMAREYAKTRGLEPLTIQEFQIGYAPNDWESLANLLKRRGFPLPLMVEADLLARREFDHKVYDRFRHRLIFPIHDHRGRVIGLGGRTLGDGQPKYLNTSETPIFHKSRILFNFHRARQAIRQERKVILFEGYVDVVSAWQAGIRNCVGTLGTSLTPEHAQILARQVDQVILCFDGDSAGVDAANRAAGILEEAGVFVKIAQLPDGMDPDEYLRKNSSESFQKQIIDTALPVTAFRLNYLKKGKNLKDEAELRKFMDDALTEISRLRHAIERDHYLRQLADEFSFSLDALKQEQYHIYRRTQKMEKNRDNNKQTWNNSSNYTSRAIQGKRKPAYYYAEQHLLALMFYNRHLIRQVEEKIGGQFNVDLFAAIAAYLYSYEGDKDEVDVASFIQSLPDTELQNTASQIAMLDVNLEVSDQVIKDYMIQILSYPKWAEIERLKNEAKQLDKVGEAGRAAELFEQVIRLEKELKQWQKQDSCGRREENAE